ncbi:MAG TPA: adenylyl-sulfate kinase [Ktedonobacteraceae bacterium]|nr:adenylyl-sulfate kinase [Ktedonobacteraceae bacterium]
MMQNEHQHSWDSWAGWSTISAGQNACFTLWFTGLYDTGKTTIAQLVQKALIARGYKVEIIDTQSLSHWLKHELHIDEDMCTDSHNYTPGYDAFVTYICTLLARNGIITIASAVSPYHDACIHAREQISHFIEIYLHCPGETRLQRQQELGNNTEIGESVYQPPTTVEISLNTSLESPERSALHILAYLEQYGYITPLWEKLEQEDEEIATIKARLQALGYLE